MIPDAAGIWHDGIVSIRAGDAIADAIYNMERASRDYTLPQSYVLNGEPNECSDTGRGNPE